MDFLVFALGIVGFVGGVIAIVALFAQRDANKLKEQQAKRNLPRPEETAR
jgi:uncharacterized membrane protein HdeD (DUF308 family)